MKNTKTILLCLMALSLFGCKKDDDSAYQPKGNYGNASVNSMTFTVNSWNSGSWCYYYDIAVSTLTQAVQDQGSVSVYLSNDGGQFWYALPFTSVNTIDYFMNFGTSTGNVEVQWIYNGTGIGTNPNTYWGSSCMFKIVTVSPAGKLANPNLNWNDYATVVKHFPQVAKNK